MPYRLLDADGAVVTAADQYFAELQASGGAVTTLYSYGNDLLRWWRFLAAVKVAWDRATPVEGRDFARWMRLADKPTSVHWRRRNGSGAASISDHAAPERRGPQGEVNPVTGRPSPGRKYKASTRAHAETVLRSFYEFHMGEGRGPVVNPFPLDRARRGGRANAHHNPMDKFRNERVGRFRPGVPRQLPRRIPDKQFNEVFAGLKYNRDRALMAFWISTGARAEELLTVTQGLVNPGEQLIGVVRKGSRELQFLPASPDAFVWLRLYQEDLRRQRAPRGRGKPLWITLRRPWRPLTYPAARAMFMRAQDRLGSNWTLHDLRHTAAHRMAEDPDMPVVDVQWVLGHASLTTTQIYTKPTQEQAIASAAAHHARQAAALPTPHPSPAPGYNRDSLNTLFGPWA